MTKHVVQLRKMVDIDNRDAPVHALGQNCVADGSHEIQPVGDMQQLIVVGMIVQLVEQLRVVEADGDVGAEYCQQLLAGFIERGIRGQIGHQFAAHLAGKVQGAKAITEQAVSCLERLLDDGYQRKIVDCFEWLVRQLFETPRCRDDANPAGRREIAHADESLELAQQQPAGFADDTAREVLQIVEPHHALVGLNDGVETMPVLADGVDLFVGADGRRQCGVQAVARKFRLEFVVVDVVVADDLDFGGETGLPGTQYNADIAHAQFFANRFDQRQTGIFLFHHDVEQDDGDVFFGRQVFDRLLRVVGVEKTKPASEDQCRAQRENRDPVNVVVIIDNQHLPFGHFRRTARLRFVVKQENVAVGFGGHGRSFLVRVIGLDWRRAWFEIAD